LIDSSKRLNAFPDQGKPRAFEEVAWFIAYLACFLGVPTRVVAVYINRTKDNICFLNDPLNLIFLYAMSIMIVEITPEVSLLRLFVPNLLTFHVHQFCS